MVVLKCVSNILVCVQCSAGFAIFTHKDTRYEFLFEIKKNKCIFRFRNIFLEILSC